MISWLKKLFQKTEIEVITQEKQMETLLTYTLQRIYDGEDCTLGVLLDPQMKHVCFTLEESWKDNKRGVSCIPVGKYTCKAHDGTRFKDVWEVTNVKDRTAILIHSGNTILDIEGCILVGQYFGKLGAHKAVLDSKKALDVLRVKIGRGGDKKLKSFSLNIVEV